MDFQGKLSRIVSKNNSLVCVGLDVDRSKMPNFLFDSSDDAVFNFNREIIDSTCDLVCAYKLNMAFYEVFGRYGFDVLERTIDYIPDDIVVILDGKRNDIGNTAKKYAVSLFETLKADAVTVNPYMGLDSVKPFLDYNDKCCFALCRTSNASAVDFQDLLCYGKPLYEHVAVKIKQWGTFGCCGAVVGATYPDELKVIRGILGDNSPLLIPGVGKQGGDVEKTVRYGLNSKGEMALINSSRGIIYASSDKDFAKSAGIEALRLRDLINMYR